MLGTYLLAALLLQIPVVQRGVTSGMGKVLTRLLGTHVEIGQVEFGYFNRLILSGVRINDQAGETMVDAARAAVKVELLPLFYKQISISSVQFYGFNVNLYQQGANEAPNFRFLIDAFKKEPSGEPSPFDLKINSVLFRRGNVSWHCRMQPLRSGKFDTNHLVLDKISVTLSLKCANRDSLCAVVKKISCEELMSGLDIRQLSFNLSANNDKAKLEDLVLEFRAVCDTLQECRSDDDRSYLRIGKAEVAYEKSDESPVRFCSADVVSEALIHPCDLVPFLPEKLESSRLIDFPALEIEAEMRGDSSVMCLSRGVLRTSEEELRLEAGAEVRNWLRKGEALLSVDIKALEATQGFLRRMLLLRGEVRARTDSCLTAVGTLRVTGRVGASRNGVDGDIVLQSGVGDVALQGEWTGSRRMMMSVRSSAVDLGQLIGNKSALGVAAFDLSMSGVMLKGEKPELEAEGVVERFTFKGHEYDNIGFAVSYIDGGVRGGLEMNDPDLTLLVEGACDVQSSTPFVRGSVEASNFSPNLLGLTEKYKGVRMDGRLVADFTGRDIEDMEGTISLDGFRMADGEDVYEPGNLTFVAERTDSGRTLRLDGSFVQAQLSGKFRISSLVAHSRVMLHGYLPALVKKPAVRREWDDEVSFSMHIDNLTPVEKLLGIPLGISSPGDVSGSFNSSFGDVSFSAFFPDVDYNGQELENVLLTVGNNDDSLMCGVRFQKNIGVTPMEMVLDARAAGDNVWSSLYWTDGAGSYEGSLNVNTRFSRSDKGELLVDAAIAPTSMVVNDTVWDIKSSDIFLSPGKVMVEGFAVEQGLRHLAVDGSISRDAADSLSVDLSNISLQYIFNMVNFHTVEFDGMASGQVAVANLFDRPDVHANLHVGGFTFNDVRFGEMDFRGGWSKERGALVLNALINDSTNMSVTKADGEIRLSGQRGIDINIDTENADIAFLNRYTENIFTDMYGRASGHVRIFGAFKHINLEGAAFVTYGGLKVNSTEVDYFVYNDSVIMEPNHIYFRNAMIYDRWGRPDKDEHYAVINGALNHENLSHLSFDFDIDAHNILGYDVRDFGDEMFCGIAYATGRASFEGRIGDINITLDGTPEAGTEFVYNMSSPVTLTDNGFISYKRDVKGGEEGKTDSIVPFVPISIEPESDLHINFILDLTPAATMKILMDPKAGDYIAINGHGNLRAYYYNKGDFTMYGTYTTDYGVYKLSIQDVIRKDFSINSGGTIVFGGVPTEADLDIEAVYVVPSVSLNDLSAGNTFSSNNVRVNCVMGIGGKAQAPEVSFDFDIPNVSEDELQMVKSLVSTEEERNLQVIYLLGIGRFYTYDYSADDQSRSSSAVKSLLSSTLSGQLNQMFTSLLGDNSNWNIGTNLSTGEVGWSDMDVEGMLTGRLLDNRLLINGNFGYRDNSTSSTSNFVGDFDLQWFLTKNGAVSLKAYSKTNDRYFTKSSLSTQGIGIEVKKDFVSWRDALRFFRLKKNQEELKQINE